MEVLFATHNKDKVDRLQRIVSVMSDSILLRTPQELSLPAIEVSENAVTLLENAEQKARAYTVHTKLPVLANDTGFYVEGEGLIVAPKRHALAGTDETVLSRAEVSERVLEFWKQIARRYGGEVDAAWVEGFVVIYGDGRVVRAESRREVVLTDEEFGVPPLQMPMRALYRSKLTGKPAIQHTEAEEVAEMYTVAEALRQVLDIDGVFGNTLYTKRS
jgi:inosine/xanthosine triphosphate pyrophosphatase family protein